MMRRSSLQRWLEGYEQAWRGAGTAALKELFSPDCSYRTAPFATPHVGLAAIEAMWEAERDGAEEVFALDSEIVAVEGQVGVVRLEVRYGQPTRQVYRDLWVIAFDDADRCRTFEEWPFWPAASDGRIASPPR
jgi:hypothetical protein